MTDSNVPPTPPFAPPTILTRAEEVAGLELTPSFANKVTVTFNPQVTRLAFGYFVAGDQAKDSVYHTVIVMTSAEAENLGKTLIGLAEISRQNAAKAAAAVLAQLAPKDAGR